QGREAVLSQDAQERSRFALTRAGHEGDIRDRRLVPALVDRGGEELVGDDEVEEGLLSLEHRLLTYKRVPHSCDTLIPDTFVRDFGRRGVGPVRSPTPPRGVRRGAGRDGRSGP